MPGLRGAVLAAAAMLLFSATAGALPQVPSPSHQRRLGFMSDKKAAKIPSPPAKSPQQQKDGGQSKANQKITWDNQQEQPPPGYLSQLSPSPAPESSSVLGKLWRKTFGKDKDKGDKNKMKQPVAAVYTGPVGKGKAKFDDKAAEQAMEHAREDDRRGGPSLESKLGMKKALPTVAALAKKGFHYQLDAKKEAEGKKAIPADAKPKVGTKGKEKAKSKKEALVSAMMTVAQKQTDLAEDKEQVKGDKATYGKSFGDVLAGLAAHIKDKSVSSKMDSLALSQPLLNKQFKKEIAKKLEAQNAATGIVDEKVAAVPKHATDWELKSKKLDKKRKVDKVRGFADAVFEQIKETSAQTGQKLRAGTYFKILDTNKDGALQRGENAAVDELFAAGDIDTIIGGPTAGEAPEKIGYEEYKIGVRDAFTRYAKE